MHPEKEKKSRTMVQAPASLSDACEQMVSTLEKLQGVLPISPLAQSAQEYLSSVYPNTPKKVKSSLTELSKATKKCQICSAKMNDDMKKTIIRFSMDWEEDTRSPRRLLVCCEKCYKVSIWSEIFGIYMRESITPSSEKPELAEIIEHYLKVNGHKLSDINIFNAAICLGVSLKTSMHRIEISTPEVSIKLDEHLKQLVDSQ
jgi:adenine specific DNA methylase Mod